MRKYCFCLAIAFVVSFIGMPTGAKCQNNLGNFRTKGSGNWRMAATWQEKSESGWVNATRAPASPDIVSVQSGHTVTADANVSAGNIYINTLGVIACGNNILSVYGSINAYSGTTVVSAEDATLTPSITPSNGNVTCSSAGRLKFVGGTRTITNTGSWGANGLVTSATVEFALDEGQTGTLQTGFKANTIIITSGVVDIQTNRLSPDNNNPAGGTLIMNGGVLVSAASGTTAGNQVITRTGTNRCGSITINSGATLRLTGGTPCIDADMLTLNGTVEYARSGSQNFLQKSGQDAAAKDIVSYTNLLVSGTEDKKPIPTQTTVVNGTFTNTAGNVISAATLLQFTANSQYVHAQNGGVIPAAAWDPVSNCLVTGMQSNAPSGLGQTFGHFTWKNEGQLSPFLINNNLFAVAGTLSVEATGATYFALVGNTNTSYSNSVGAIRQSGGTFNLNVLNSGAPAGTATLSILNDLSVYGGTFSFAAGSVNPASPIIKTTVSLGGNLLVTSSAHFFQSHTAANIYSELQFAKNGTQTVLIENGTGSRGNVDYLIQAGSKVQLLGGLTCVGRNRVFVNGALDLQHFILTANSGSATFVLNSGATLLTANAGGIKDAIGISGAKTFSAGAKYVFTGNGNQSTGFVGLAIGSPSSVHIANALGTVTADSEVHFTNNATLQINAGSSFNANTRTFHFGTGGSVIINGTLQTANTAPEGALSGSATATVAPTNNPVITTGDHSVVECNSAVMQHLSARTFNGVLKVNNTAGVRLRGPVATKGLQLEANCRLEVNGQKLTIDGMVSGTGTISGSSESQLLISGGAGTLLFTQNASILKDLTLGPGATASLGTPLNITGGASAGTVTTSNGSVLTTNGNLTLLSTAGGTASVAASTGTILGNVTVECYVALPQQNGTGVSNRRYRLLTSPVKGTSINASWQEGRTFSGTTFSPSAPIAGYGLMITGQAQGSAAAANGNGFDYWDAIANSYASIRYYQGAPSGEVAQWKSPGRTTFPDAFNRQEAYLVFVRGDRSTFLAGPGAATILRATGELKQGDTVSATLYGTGKQSHTLIGNPYAAPLDFKRLAAGNEAIMENYFWVWNAAQGTATGAYAIVKPDANDPEKYQVIPNPTPTSSAANGIIAAGQGFFISPKQSTIQTVVFKEAYKAVAGQGRPLFRGQGLHSPATAKLYINLNAPGGNGESLLLDGVLAQFSSLYEDKSDDIAKAVNGGENLALLKNGRHLIVASQPVPKQGEVLQLRLWNTAERDYQLALQSERFIGISAQLEDRFAGTLTSFPLTGETTVFPFSVTTDPASKDPLRFRIVFQKAAVLPLKIKTFAATRQGSLVQLRWSVDGDNDISAYEVERSADGRSFASVGTISASRTVGTQTYRLADLQPRPLNYYRLRLLGTSGINNYSAVVIEQRKTVPGWQVYPNPLTGRQLQVVLYRQPESRYCVNLYNISGQLLWQRQLMHEGGSQVVYLALPTALPSGIYRLTLTGNKSNTAMLTLCVE